MLRQFSKQMPIKIALSVDLEAVGDNQDMILKGATINLHIIIINLNKRMHFPQITTNARSICRNMIMLAPVVA